MPRFTRAAFGDGRATPFFGGGTAKPVLNAGVEWGDLLVAGSDRKSHVAHPPLADRELTIRSAVESPDETT